MPDSKELMLKSSVQTVLDAANSAIEQLQTNDAQVQASIDLNEDVAANAGAMAAVDLQRGFSGDNDINVVPPTGGSSEGDFSYYLKGNTQFQLIRLESGSWEDFGKPLQTAPTPRISTSQKWEGTKHASNPVVTGSSNDADQFYPPEAFLDPVSGKFYLYAKSGGKIYLFRSDDGKTGWTEIGLVLDKGSTGEFDVTRIEFSCVRYVGGTYNLLYTGENNDVTEIGLATSASIESIPYTKQGSIYDGSDAKTQFGMEMNYFDIGSVIVENGEYIFYLTGALQIGGQILNHAIFCATGTSISDINARNIIFRTKDINGLHNNALVETVQRPNVFKHNGAFYMLFTAGIASDTYNERAIYAAIGGPYDFTPTREPVIEVGDVAEWDDRRVYCACVPCVQDGSFSTPVLIDDKLPVYFAGHDTGVTGNNQGQTGLMLFSEIPDLGKFTKPNNKHETDYFAYDVSDDDVNTIMPSNKGYKLISIMSLTNRPSCIIIAINYNSTPHNYISIVSQDSSAAFEVSEGTTPTGTTGTDGVSTIHLTTSGDLIVENRAGGARSYKAKVLDTQESLI